MTGLARPHRESVQLPSDLQRPAYGTGTLADVLPGAAAALARWSESIGLLVRRVPEVQVVPVIVSGVLSAAAQRHPLTRLRRQRRDQEWLGAILQVLVPAYHAVTVRVAFGPPLAGADLVAAQTDARCITAAIARAAARLIEHPPADWQIVLGQRRFQY